MTISVPVSLAERSYQIHIGENLLARSGEFLRPQLSNGITRIPVVTDENVAPLHYLGLETSFRTAGLTPIPIVLPAGEETKSFRHLEYLTDKLLSESIERGGLIVAFGGGVIGDLAGLTAGILKRGIDFVQIPTTLLAQVDSSVGGKTAINTEQGKNLVGLFHQPRLVVSDTGILATLPRRQLVGGYAEVVKYGLLGDSDFFTWLEENGVRALDGNTDALTYAVAHSCRMKAAIVMGDERETGDRTLLNLGHTFGHALEAATHYSDRLIHGEGVALGCVLAFKLSAKLGLVSPAELAKIERHFTEVGLPTHIAEIPGSRLNPDELLVHMQHDKKTKAGRMVFILAKGIGRAFIAQDVPQETVRAVLEED